jgi:hypothetical protein
MQTLAEIFCERHTLRHPDLTALICTLQHAITTYAGWPKLIYQSKFANNLTSACWNRRAPVAHVSCTLNLEQLHEYASQ